MLKVLVKSMELWAGVNKIKLELAVPKSQWDQAHSLFSAGDGWTITSEDAETRSMNVDIPADKVLIDIKKPIDMSLGFIGQFSGAGAAIRSAHWCELSVGTSGVRYNYIKCGTD